MSSANTFKEVPLSQLPRKTFLQKAREDLVACRRNVSGGFRWCGTSRRAMVNLLERAILEAEQKDYDDELFVAYHDIDVMIQSWYFEDRLKSIISTTLREVQRNIIERQESVPAKLSQEKRMLEGSLGLVQQARDILQEALKEKTEIIKILREDSRELRQRNKGLEQELAKEKAVSAGLREELERARASTSETSSEEGSTRHSPFDSNYSPRLFGGIPVSSAHAVP